MEIYPQYYGFLAALCSILMFGSFNIPLKAERTQRVNPDPMVFQIYLNFAIFISSWLVLSYNPLYLTVWGILSAVLWMISSLLAIYAIQNAGLAVSQGIWSGFTIIVSFLWGALVFQETPSNIGLSVVGLFMLLFGIAGLSIAGSDLLDRWKNRKTENLNIEETSMELTSLTETTRKNNSLFGIVCAASLALTNGSMLVPIKFSPVEAQGINFLASFGIGVMAITPLISVLYFMLLRKSPVWDVKNLLLPGLVGGFMWNIGNWASIYATNILGYTVGFPLAQCALLIGGFWGIVLFKEIRGGLRIGFFVLSSCVMLGGAVVLTLYGTPG
jgi:glucose uptake protein GlcU